MEKTKVGAGKSLTRIGYVPRRTSVAVHIVAIHSYTTELHICFNSNYRKNQLTTIVNILRRVIKKDVIKPINQKEILLLLQV